MSASAKAARAKVVAGSLAVILLATPTLGAQDTARVVASNTTGTSTTGQPTPPTVTPATTEWVEVEDGHTGETVRIPASELGPVPQPSPEAEAEARADAGMPPRDRMPTRWAQGPTRCSRYGRRRYCDGPLRVPAAVGPEAETARRLGLGSHFQGGIALGHEPRANWMAEVRGMDFHEQILWPVDGGGFVRGLKPDRRVRVVSRRRGRRVVRTVVRPGHNGVDIAARPGTHIFAIEEGLVVYAQNEMRGYGNVVLVLHSNGTVSLYAHMRQAWVFAGQTVQRGQILGEVGDTGLTTGPHLHFEWRRNGVPLNPVPRFTRRPARPGEPEPPPLDLPTEEPEVATPPDADPPEVEVEDGEDLPTEDL